MKKSIIFLVLAGLIASGGWFFFYRTHESSKIVAYELLNTIEYSGQGHYFQQATGMMVVQKELLESGDVTYTYSFVADVSADGGENAGQVTFPPVSIIRNPQSERIVGGDRFLKNLGIVANAALDAIKGDLPLDGTSTTRRFEFDRLPGFPDRLTYELRARRQSLDTPGAAIAALAVSEPFTYSVPGSDLVIRGRHRVLCLLDDSMDEVFFLGSNFQATAPEGNQLGELRIESMMYQLDDNKPLSLKGLDEEFTRYFEFLDLDKGEPEIVSNTGLPPWAMHSLAVRDTADLVASAAIEGKPNFAICATVGTVLLVDSAVSLGTSLLHDAGVIDWEWKGIPNYTGRGVGLVAAKGWEEVTDTDVDEEKWKDVGGMGGDIASLFIPSKTLGTGLKMGTGGIKVIKGQKLVGKVLRISEQGLDLIDAGRGWHNSVKTAETINDLNKAVKGATIAAELLAQDERGKAKKEWFRPLLPVVFDFAADADRPGEIDCRLINLSAMRSISLPEDDETIWKDEFSDMSVTELILYRILEKSQSGHDISGAYGSEESESERVERQRAWERERVRKQNANSDIRRQLLPLTSEMLLFKFDLVSEDGLWSSGTININCFFGEQIDVEENCRRLEKTEFFRGISIPGINGLAVINKASPKSQQRMAGLFHEPPSADGKKRVLFSSRLLDQMFEGMANCIAIRLAIDDHGMMMIVGTEYLSERRARQRVVFTPPEEPRARGPLLRRVRKENIDDVALKMAEQLGGKVLATSAKGDFWSIEIEGEMLPALDKVIFRR